VPHSSYCSTVQVDVIVRAARPDEADALLELAVRSKGHWGYDDAFLDACRAELAVAPDACDGEHVLVAVQGDTIAGFVQIDGNPPKGELAALFVDPVFIGSGVGGRLLAAAVSQAAAMGFASLVIDSDPEAEEFYLRAGAVRIAEVPSGSIPGRLLPQLELAV
jgi:GNAT superfamily N-acetyltransferase